MTLKFRSKTAGRVAAAALSLLLGGPAAAQSSAYGCEGLVDSDALPAVEGDGGMFYRVDPDMMMAQGLTDRETARIADFSKALKAGGTTLVYLPIPVKSLGQPWQLPPMARHLGFDVDVATTVHDLGLQKLVKAGVTVVDTRAALAEASVTEPVYFGPDERLSGHGARILAKAIAEVIGGAVDLPKAAYRVSEGGDVQIASGMRLDLQDSCASTIPLPAAAQVFAEGREPGSLFDREPVRIALLGTQMTGEAVTNLPALVQAETGLTLGFHAVEDGGAFAALSGYLTSDAFRESRPDILIWEHPSWESISDRGDQPMYEVIAAVAADCSQRVRMSMSTDGRALIAGLEDLAPGTSGLLFFTDGNRNTALKMTFRDRFDLPRTRFVERHPEAVPTGRFHVPLTAQPEDLAAVEIEVDGTVGPDARLFACTLGGQP